MTHYYDTLFEYVSQIIEMPEHDKNQCRRTFKPLRVPANTLLDVAGKYRSITILLFRVICANIT